jgi:hypothetical protein
VADNAPVRAVSSSSGAVHLAVTHCADRWCESSAARKRDTPAGFFEIFPNYRNSPRGSQDVADGVVVVRCRSECSLASLDRPAEWRAEVMDGRVDNRRHPSRCRVGRRVADESAVVFVVIAS